MDETPSLGSFLLKFLPNVGALMSGAASVPLTAAAIYFAQAPLKALFGILAAFAVVRACYLVWRDSLRAAQATITELSGVIAERDETIRKLSEKPPRSPAEQHDYETASAALKLLGDKGKTAAAPGAHHQTGEFDRAFLAGGSGASHGTQSAGMAQQVYPPDDAARTKDRQSCHGS